MTTAPRLGQTATAPAKVNLTLHVTGKRSDGYHLLDSLVAFGCAADVLTVSDGAPLTVGGPFARGVPTDGRNLILRALDAVGAATPLHLDKHLPHPAGIGGGSSDAAAALRLVGATPTPDTLLSLGADMPVCWFGRACRMGGIGEAVAPSTLPPLPTVLVNPGVPLATPDVFAALATPDNAPMGPLPEGADLPDWLRWLADQRNDLEAPAVTCAPVIAEVLTALRQTDAAVARMSGSGATCFGLYPGPEAAMSAAKALSGRGWWVQAGTLT